MELRRRIVIPTDGSIPEPLPQPHFDTDAANSARPVRPLGYSDETYVQPRMAPLAVSAVRKRSRVWPFVLALVIVFAVGVGLAGGYGIANYESFSKPEAILAGSTFHTDENAPEMTFTAPPEEELAELAEQEDPDGQVAEEGDGDDDIVFDPDIFPIPGRKPPVRSAPPAPPAPSENDENIRPRRVPDDQESRTSARRRTGRPEDENDRRLRRLGRGMVSKIRQIFEGKP